MSRNWKCFLALGALTVGLGLRSQGALQLPTANRALLDQGPCERFFVGTVGKPWTTGEFGCVRSEGWQMHEGLDIRCLQRDAKGEATDPVLATGEGKVAYINRNAALSNYGRYLVLRHDLQGLELYSLYAHLREVRADLKPGASVRAGETVGIMGRSTNTREPISKERAHVHFELNLFLNDAFSTWFKRHYAGERNDHGVWNGQNLVGLDPKEVFLQQQRAGNKFDLVQFVREQAPLCRVLVRDTDFSWLRRYPMFQVPNPKTQTEPVIAYELELNYNGIPFRVTPRVKSEVATRDRYRLLSVNAEEYNKRPCRRLVTRKGNGWELAPQGLRFLQLLTH